MTETTLEAPRMAFDGARVTPSLLSALGDDALLGLQASLAETRRLIDADSAIVAAEVDRRSSRELGYDGLAQKRGARTPEALVQQVTGLSLSESRKLVRVGTLLTQHTLASPTLPWLADCAAAVARGHLSLDAAEAIRTGVGEPAEHVTADQLAGLVTRLVIEAAQVSVERLAARARELRDELDEQGVADREQQRRDRRFLSLTLLADGMTRITGLLDPESAAIITGAIDAATSPRRGGPRFVDSDEAERAERLLADPRTTPQLALDSLVELVRIATLADSAKVLGKARVAVRVHVAERDLRRGLGLARIEGQPDAASVATAERYGCEAGFVPVMFDDDGQVINVGRDQRLYTNRQRIGLAARDGGCRFPGCDRPPSWTEAHHIKSWHHGGQTDLDNGVLLCRHHHLLVHNNGWRIDCEGTTMWVTPPPQPDGVVARIPMPPKYQVLR
ncbi:MAG: DUF222 domain-containing protein [Rhodoglobus sp.]